MAGVRPLLSLRTLKTNGNCTFSKSLIAPLL